MELVVVLCRFGGFRVGKTLAFSRPSRTDAWCGCLSVWSCSGWASFSACVLSPYISSGILPMSPPDAQVFVVSFSGNKQVCPPLPFPSFSALRNLGSGEARDVVPDLLPMYPFDGSALPIYMDFPLPRCRLGMLLPLLCTCHPSF